MKQRNLRRLSCTIAFLGAIAFIIKFAGPSILKLYVELGIGNCRNIPVFCMAPEEKIIVVGEIEKSYFENMLEYSFPKMKVFMPKGFSVTQQAITKDYYKRRKKPYRDAAVYLFYEKPGFFPGLFPQLRREGINDNYAFLKRTMYARINDISGIADTFFIIMKGIFIPDLGDQKQVKMAQFKMANKRGFINYNLDEIASSPATFGGKAPRNDGHKPVNYFDCNVVDDQGGFFKVYIKDEGARLDLNRVLAIISTLESVPFLPA